MTPLLRQYVPSFGLIGLSVCLACEGPNPTAAREAPPFGTTSGEPTHAPQPVVELDGPSPLDAPPLTASVRPDGGVVRSSAPQPIPAAWPTAEGFAGGLPDGWADADCTGDAHGNWVCLLPEDVSLNPGPCAFSPEGDLIVAAQALWYEKNASLLVTRFDSTGQAAWTRVWNRAGGFPTHTIAALGVAVQSDGRITWAGRDCLQDSDASPADGPGYYAGSCIDAHVATLSASGELLWELVFGTRDGIDGCTDVALAPEGGVYVGGWFQAPLRLPGLADVGSRGGADFFVLALDPNGEARWVQTFGSPSDDGDALRLASRPNGDLFVRGNYTENLSNGGFAALLDATGRARFETMVPYTVGHATFLGGDWYVAAQDSLFRFDAEGQRQVVAVPGIATASHLLATPSNALLAFAPGFALTEVTPEGEVLRSLRLHDWSEPWYHGGLCVGADGVVGITGTAREATDFGFLETPDGAAAGRSFVLHLAQW